MQAEVNSKGCKQQYPVKLFDYNHLAHFNSSLANAKIYVLLYNFCLGGRFNRGFFCVMSLGGLYLEGLLHGGAYFQNITVLHGVVLECAD